MLKRITIALLGAVAFTAAANAGPVSDTLYYTTFGGGQNVWSVTGTYTGNGTAGNGTFTLGSPTNIASTPGADGLVFNPNNGDLLVGGQGNSIHQVNPGTGAFTNATPGMNVYEISVDPNGNVVWGGGQEGGDTHISSTPINPFGGAGTTTAVTGAVNTITHITFAPNLPTGTAFYTSSGDDGTSPHFGTINLATGVTTAITLSLPGTTLLWHGMEYDPFSGDLILAGGNEVLQINPITDAVLSVFVAPSGVQFDQGAVDGLGHIFWADNNGRLLFLDYSTTDLVGSPNNFVYDQSFTANFDDIAPLVGAGSRTVPEPMTLTLFGAGLLGAAALRRRKKAKV
jgi:hypothetical protein